MLCSPTEKGVIIIGGVSEPEGPLSQFSIVKVFSNALMELTGNSRDSLKWTTLRQKLRFPRSDHVSFPITEGIMK